MYNQSILLNLEMYAQKTPEKIALVMEKSEISYHQLFLQASTLAASLCEMRLQGERLAVHLPNSIELAIIYLASLMAGAVVVPLSIALKQPEVLGILSNTSPKVLIGNTGSYSLFDDGKRTELKHIFSLHENPPHPFQYLKMKAGALKKKFHSSPDAPAAIFYSSGSTNQPKGIVHSERSLTAMMDSIADSLDLTTDGRFLMSEPMSNCSGYIQSLLPLFVGATTIIMPFFSIKTLIEGIQHYPTSMALMGRGNRDIIEAPELTKKHFTNIAFNLSGGDKISKELLVAFKEKTGMPIRYSYGMSECLVLTVNKSLQSEKMGSVGKVGKNSTIKLLDQNLTPVAPGELGEVWVKGPNCMLGYWQEPDLTHKMLVDGWLRTGDLARCDAEGFYWLLGRLKYIIIRDGDNISPFEIEEVLSKHPAVHGVGVIGVPHAIEGEVPNAFVELKPGHTVSKQELLAFIRKHLEDNKVPTAIFIVDELPRTLSGKIAREKLKSLIA